MAQRSCVFCRRQPAQPLWEPFCSESCKLQDLAKWIDGTYRVPADPLPDEDDSGGDTNNNV
ncbi:MAG: DNA gyrase inhibitor YacG [Acidobacteria bacterium]|nr:DNA gyrase inhibitor YacG [Acidobacteriota bacterium]